VSSYYYAKKREAEPAARETRDAIMKDKIVEVWKGRKGREVYGARKVWLELNRQGIPVARCTVERLMRDLGIGGVRPNGLALSDQVWAEQVELESPDDVGDARLAGSAGREVAGFLGLAGAGPVRAVPGEGARGEDLEQERGEREISLLRGKKPRPCPSRRPGRAES
jgi:hypothetical protein